MTEETEYHEYRLPTPFDIDTINDWGYQLNDVFDQLDEDIIIRGTVAERDSLPESTSATKGRIFLVVDSRSLYVDNGTTWKRLGGQFDVESSGGFVIASPSDMNFAGDLAASNPTTGEAKITAPGSVSRGGDSMSGALQMDADIENNAGTAIWDNSAGYIQQQFLQNDSLTINSGDGLKNGGSVALGGSTTLDIEPADFAGTYLSDDGADNLTINLGTGVEGDGSGNIRLDEGYNPTWTSNHTFNAGIDMGGTIDLQNTNQVTNAPEPTSDTDLARKQYVDGVVQGLNLKESAVASPTTNIDLTSTTDPNPVDGYTLADGDRVLLKEQTTSSENGIYDANTATDPSTWTRSVDFDEDAEVTAGTFVFVEEGTTNGSTSWIVTSDDPIAVGTDAILWSQFASAGEISAGDGLSKSGQTLSAVVSDFAGSFLSDDGSNDLQVNLGRGIESDGSDNIRFDEDTAYTFTSEQTFDGDIAATNALAIDIDSSASTTTSSLTITHDNGATTLLTVNESGDIGTGSVTLWDESNSWIPQARVEQGSGSGLDADTVDGYESGDLRVTKNVAQFSSTDTSTDINQTTWVDIPWDVQQILDSAYTHDATNTPAQITFDNAGTYRVVTSLAFDSDTGDVNPGVKFAINGTRLDTQGLTGYTSLANGHDEASNTVTRLIEVSAGDTLKVQTIQQANTGTVTLRSNESVLSIEQLSEAAALVNDADTLDGLDSTAFVKTDGSNNMSGTLGINLAGNNQFERLTNTDTNDELRIGTDSVGDFTITAYDDSASSERGEITFDADTNTVSLYQNVEISNSLSVGGDLTDGTNTIYDQSASEIPDSAMGSIDNSTLTNSSVTITGGTDINAGSVSLGGSVTVDHADTSTQGNVSTGGASVIDDINVDGRGHVTNMNTQNRNLTDWQSARDDEGIYLGNNNDFSFTYESSSDELVLSDSGGVELIRQPKSGSTQFLQGADIGSIEAPEDSLTQLVNAANTSATASGDTVGYTLAVDNQTGLQVSATSDGSGGLSSGPDVEIPNGDLTDGTNVIYDQSASEIPDSAMGSIDNSTLTNDTITVTGGTDISGGSASLGGSVTVDHADTSTQGDVATGGSTVIDDIDLDGRGHVTNLNTENRSLDDWDAANSALNFGTNDVNDVYDLYSSTDGRILLRAQGTSGELGFYDESTSTWTIRQYNSGNLELDASGSISFLTNTTGISHTNLDNITSDDHHTKTATSDVTSANWGDYEIQKNGTDGTGIINFKT